MNKSENQLYEIYVVSLKIKKSLFMNLGTKNSFFRFTFQVKKHQKIVRVGEQHPLENYIASRNNALR